MYLQKSTPHNFPHVKYIFTSPVKAHCIHIYTRCALTDEVNVYLYIYKYTCVFVCVCVCVW